MRGRSALCHAYYPDSGATGYPGAYQYFDKKARLWRWLFVGSSTHETTPKKVQSQADSAVTDVPIGTRVRFVHVKRWVRVYTHGTLRTEGWRAQLDHTRTVEVVKQKNTPPKCYRFRSLRRKP